MAGTYRESHRRLQDRFDTRRLADRLDERIVLVRPAGEDVLAPDLSRIGLKWTPVLDPEDPVASRR